MKKFQCECSNTLYFENHLCLSCEREVGWCPICKEYKLCFLMKRGYTCTNPQCHASLDKCYKYAVSQVCNQMIEATAPEASKAEPLCNYCCFNHTIPDLTVAGNIKKW